MGSVDKKKLLSAAYYYSCTRFTLNLFSLFEDMSEAEPSDFMIQYTKELTKHVKGFLNGKTDFDALESMRDGVLGLLDQVMHYLNCFCIHAYAMDRVGAKLCGADNAALTPDALAGEVMDFVMDGENDLEINRRVQAIIGELPVRFTKSKFYSVIEESMKPYRGRDKRDLERMTTNIRSAAALPILGRSAADAAAELTLFQEIHTVALELEKCDYLRLNKEEYEGIKERFERNNDRLSLLLGQLVCLPELVNDLYVMERSAAYTEDSGFHSTIHEALHRILDMVETGIGEKNGNDWDIHSLLQPLEGKQELYWEQYLKNLGKNSGPEGSEDEDIFVVGRLLSGSIAASLKFEPESIQVTEQILSASLNELFTELETRLKRTAKFTARAVMAKVLSEIPVWFNSLEEIETYIKDSLALCLDTSEKNACMVNLKKIVVEGNALV